MNPYRHEAQHLLRSRAVIAVVIVGVIAGTFGYLAVSNAASGITISGAGFWYSSGGGFEVSLWVFDNSGNPVSGVQVGLTVLTASNFSSPPPTALFNGTTSSDPQGQVHFVVPVRSGNYSAYVRATYAAVSQASFAGALTTNFRLFGAPSGVVHPVGSPFNEVTDNFYTVSSDYLLIWAGSNGQVPSGDSAIFCSFVYNATNFSIPPPSNCTGRSGVSTQFLGPITGYRTVLPNPASPTATLAYYQALVEFVEVTNASGNVLFSSSIGSACFGICTGPPIFEGPSGSPGGSSPGPSVIAEFAAGLSFFLPLMALLLTYWSYARPRLTGSLEAVLVRPVTRRGIFFVRFGVVGVALLLASLAEVLLLDLGVSEILREPLPLSFLAPLIGGLAIAAIGFAGLVFLSAHTFRSTAPVLALGIGLLLAFSLFWEEVVLLGLYALGLLNNPQVSASTIQSFVLRSQLFAPPQFPNIVSRLLTGLSNQLVGSGTPGDAGVTAPLVGVVAALWIGVPFLLTYWRVVTRD